MHPDALDRRTPVRACLTLCLSTLLVLLAIQPAAAVPSGAAPLNMRAGVVDVVDVVGDDPGDRFVGSGGLVLPGSIGDDTRRRVATCAGCRWRLADPCAASGDDGAHAACMSVTRGCARSAQLLRVWISDDAGATWRDLGLICLPPGGPVTVEQVGSSVAEEFERAVPATGLVHQPRRGVLPTLPVVFHSTQPSALPPSEHVINGVAVMLYPRPTWTWDFGDGSVMTTSVPGSSYPDFTVSHAYVRGGNMRVQVTTTWNAAYTIDGIGPFQVSSPVIQTARTTLIVGQARAVLVP